MKGLLPQDFATLSSPMSRLILSALNLPKTVKVQIFLSFLGLDPSNGTSERHEWGFLLKLLSCLCILLGDDIESTLRSWASLKGTDIPIQCAMDVLANVYNTDSPSGPTEFAKSQSNLH